MSLVSDRILTLAVERVVETCRSAMQEPPEHDHEWLHPLSKVHAVNLATLESACVSAQLVLDAEPLVILTDSPGDLRVLSGEQGNPEMVIPPQRDAI